MCKFSDLSNCQTVQARRLVWFSLFVRSRRKGKRLSRQEVIGDRISGLFALAVTGTGT